MTKRTTPKKTRAKKTPVEKTEEEVSKVEPNTLDMIIALKIRATQEREYALAAVLREIEKAYPNKGNELYWVKKAVNKTFHIVGMEDTWKWERLGEEKEVKVGEQSFTTQQYKITLPETLWENKPDLKETVKKVINTDRKLLAEKIALELLKTGHFVQRRTSLIKRIKGLLGIDYKSTVLTNEEKLAEVAINHADTLLKAIDKTKK